MFFTKICIVSSVDADEATEELEETDEILLERILMDLLRLRCSVFGLVCRKRGKAGK